MIGTTREPERDKFRERGLQQATFHAGSNPPKGNSNFTRTAHKEYRARSAVFVRGTGMSREEFDAKLERTEAKVEKSMAEFRADMAGFEAKVLTEVRKAPTRGFLTATAIAIVGAIFGAMALMATQFGNGVMVTTASVDRASEAMALAEQNAQQVRDLSVTLEDFLAELRQAQESSSTLPQ